MKKIISLAIIAFLAISCGNDEPSPQNPTPQSDKGTATLSGNTLTYKTSSSTHTFTLNESATTTTVTFSHFPASQDEFAALQSKLLGKSKPGTLALCLMSFEMYRRDRSVGEKCVKSCFLSFEAITTINLLKQKFPATRSATTTDSYQQPYLVAAYLKGATQANSYTPSEPYVITLTWNDNPNVKQGKHLSDYNGNLYHYNVSYNGDGMRDADVLVPDDGGNVMVHHAGNIIVNVPTISSWNDLLK